MRKHKAIIPAAIRGRYGEGKIIQRIELRPDFVTKYINKCPKG